MSLLDILGFPGGSDGKESARNAGDLGLISGFNLWVGKIPWRREWLPNPVFLTGEIHGRGAWQATAHRVAKSWT